MAAPMPISSLLAATASIFSPEVSQRFMTFMPCRPFFGQELHLHTADGALVGADEHHACGQCVHFWPAVDVDQRNARFTDLVADALGGGGIGGVDDAGVDFLIDEVFHRAQLVDHVTVGVFDLQLCAARHLFGLVLQVAPSQNSFVIETSKTMIDLRISKVWHKLLDRKSV